MNNSSKIINLINNKNNKGENLTFVCIGTDRVIGDSIGPIVGSNLQKYVKNNNIKNVKIIGNLENNFNSAKIKESINNREILIVIDSAVSNSYNIGDIVIDEKPIKIRQALKDNISIDSNINIKCVVGKNFKNSNENFLMLQNIKLGIILNIAEALSEDLYEVIENYNL